jgi:Concanavalin A-like lectin/glucanases superfamily
VWISVCERQRTARRSLGDPRRLNAARRPAIILLTALGAMTIALLPGGYLAGAVAALASGLGYIQTFDGAPAAPTPYSPPGWDVTVHSRDRQTWKSLEPMNAMHGSDCSAPPATHAISAYQDTVFQCRDHLMTAINASGYGVIYLTPNQLLDFSQGEAVLKFDVSTLRSSLRDWIDLWITPYEDNLELPIDDAYQVDLNGTPRNAVQIKMDQFNGQTTFRPFLVRNFQTQGIDGANWWTGYESFLTPSAIRRDTFELHLSRTHIKFGMPDPMGDPTKAFWWVDKDIADLGWSRGVVQLGHHSYNPQKDCALGPGVCQPNTWHWDNVSLSPAAPFTIIRAPQSYVDATMPTQVTFPAQAPQQANLRFAGIGTTLDVSFDRGATWQPAHVQPASRAPVSDHFRSYWTPVPAGIATIQFRGTNWWGGPWMIRDISIWAPGASSTTSGTTTSTPQPVHSNAASLRLDGTSTSYASAPHDPELNLTGDWTVETWFKDQQGSATFDHFENLLVSKNLNDWDAEYPYYISLGWRHITAGIKTGGKTYFVTYDLAAHGVSAAAWHHVAATFQANSKWLTLYFDGVAVAAGNLEAGPSSGNAAPEQLGTRAYNGGPFSGLLGDVRIWNLVRTPSQIAGAFKQQLTGGETGLVGYWKLGEGMGTTAADATVIPETMTLHGSAGWSTDVHS